MLGYSFYDSVLKGNDFFEKYKEFLPQLPPVEQNIIEYYVRDKMRQVDIAILMGMTQGAVSNRLKRAHERLEFLTDLKKANFETILGDLHEVIESEFDLEIIRSLITTTCQSETAWRINEKFRLTDPNKMNQVKVRHRFEKCLIKLKELGLKNGNQKYLEYYKKLMLIKNGLYLLHEVKLPHFER